MKYAHNAILWGLLLQACSAAPPKPQDASHVQMLRFRITEVRHAIDQTRATITRSRGASYLPELTFRLAELLSEEARYHYRVARERAQGNQSALHVPQVRALKEHAIETYRRLIKQHPSHPLAVRALFNVAHEHRELGQFDEMLGALKDLVRQHPNHALVPRAELIIGDYHFDRNELRQAQRHYQAAAAGSPSKTRAMAHYKLAWVWVNLDACARALDHFEKSIVIARSFDRPSPHEGEETDDSPEPVDRGSAGDGKGGEEGEDGEEDHVDVRREAVVDSVYCFSRERKPGTALSYLRKLSDSRGTYLAGLAKMASRFVVMDNAHAALPVLRELLDLGPADADRIEDIRRMHTVLRRLKDYRNLGRDIERFNRVLAQHVSRTELADKARAELIVEVEKYERDLLTRAQQRLLRRSGGRARAVAQDLAAGYRSYLDTFVAAPERVAMQLNLGDVLDMAGDKLAAGLAALEVAQANADSAGRSETLHDAVVRFQASLAPDNVADPELRVLARAGLRRAGRELLRYPLPQTRQAQIKFAIAETFYDEGRYREAIDLLTAVAFEHPGSQESAAAVRLVLDSYNATEDFTGLIHAGRRFLAEGGPARGELAAEIRPILAAAEGRLVDDLSLDAAGDGGSSVEALVAFADENAGTDLGERALVNAFLAARAAGDSGKMYVLGEQLASRYPKSKQLPGVLSSLAQIATARFELARASDFLRKTASGRHPQRVQLLVASGQLFEERGKAEDALAMYREALRDGTSHDALDALARLWERLGKPRELVRDVEPWASQAGPDTLARLGMAYLNLGRSEDAQSMFDAVLSMEASASADAMARAHYGVAELLSAALGQFPSLDDPEVLQEYLAVLGSAQQSYLNAARSSTPDYTPAALARLADLGVRAAERLGRVNLSSSLSGADRSALSQAISARTEQLKEEARQARAACADQAWSAFNFQPVVRSCLKDAPPSKVAVRYDRVRAQRRAASDGKLAELRDRAARNPEDLPALRALGEAFLKADDPHSARSVFAAAAEHGGGPEELNLLGIASHRVGDTASALNAFARAAEAGLEAGRQNLARLLRAEGLEAAAKKSLQQIPRGRSGGRLLALK